MAHKTQDHTFATEQDANDFITRMRARKDPATDLYLSLPHKNENPDGQPTWTVSVDEYY